jgi:phosphoglycolate/pyridoxal phosphate phosphatase family enzyme
VPATAARHAALAAAAAPGGAAAACLAAAESLLLTSQLPLAGCGAGVREAMIRALVVRAPGIVGIARRGGLRAPPWRPRSSLAAAAAAEPEPAWGTHTAAHATHANVAQLLACTDNFVFDCDGVLYTPEGAIEGAAVALASLRAAGKGCFFVTNNAAATRVELQDKLRSKGIEADVSEIFGAAYLTACYLRQRAERGEFSGKVYVAGAEGLAEELRGAGLTVIGGAEGTSKLGQYSAAEMAAVAIDPEIKAVVVGMDVAGFCYYTMAFACRCLVENAGCEFINTNPDLRFPIASASAADPVFEGCESSYLPEAGALAAVVAACTGRVPTVCGKPSPLAMELICAEHGIDRKRTAMVGDTLYTDIAFGALSSTFFCFFFYFLTFSSAFFCFFFYFLACRECVRRAEHVGAQRQHERRSCRGCCG